MSAPFEAVGGAGVEDQGDGDVQLVEGARHGQPRVVGAALRHDDAETHALLRRTLQQRQRHAAAHRRA